MPAQTPGILKVREIADRALNMTEGIRINFTITQHGSYNAAASASRSFQQLFCAMRARERKRHMTLHTQKYETPDTNLRGPYDHLACMRTPMPDEAGWSIRLVPATMIDWGMDIEDAATGEKIFAEDEEFNEANKLLQYWLRKIDEYSLILRNVSNPAPFAQPIANELMRPMWEYRAMIAMQLYDAGGFAYPDYVQNGVVIKSAPTSTEPRNAPEPSNTAEHTRTFGDSTVRVGYNPDPLDIIGNPFGDNDDA